MSPQEYRSTKIPVFMCLFTEIFSGRRYSKNYLGELNSYGELSLSNAYSCVGVLLHTCHC